MRLSREPAALGGGVPSVATPTERVDRFGAVASSLCAAHCAVCAFLPAFFGLLGVGVLASHGAEWAFTGIAICFAAVAAMVGWRRHGSVLVVAMLGLGIVGLLASRGVEMGSAHHHDDHAAATDDHHAEGASEHGEVSGEHADHDEASMGHMVGGVIGVVGGLVLLSGHLLNIRAARRCRRECCNEWTSTG